MSQKHFHKFEDHEFEHSHGSHMYAHEHRMARTMELAGVARNIRGMAASYAKEIRDYADLAEKLV